MDPRLNAGGQKHSAVRTGAPNESEKDPGNALILAAHSSLGLTQARVGQPRVEDAANGDPEFLTFEGMMRMMVRQRKVILSCLAAGFVVAGILYKTQPKMYQAQATFEVELPNGDYMNHRQLNPTAEPGANMMEPYLQTQLRLLQSQSLLERVTDEVHLAQAKEYLPTEHWWNRFATAEAAGPGLETDKTKSRGEFFEAVREHLDVRVLFNTQIVQVSFEAQNPELAAKVANTLAAEYQASTVDRQVDEVNQTGDLLEKQISDAHRALEESEKRLQDYVSTSGLLSGGDKDSVAEERLRQLQISLTAAHDARIADQARYNEALANNAKGGSDVLDSDALRAYRMKISDLRQQVAQESEILQPEHYKVRELRAQLTEVEQAYQREREGTLRRLKSQFESAQANEQALLQDYNEQVGRASREMTNAVRYASLKSDVETHQQLYSSLVQRSKEASVLSAMRASNVKQVDLAEVPYKPIRPSKAVYAALGFGLGLLPGFLIAFTRERKQQRLPQRSSSAVQPLGLRSLGVIPQFEPSTATEDVELASWSSPESPFARVVEGASHFLFPRGQWPRAVGVTAPNDGAGKTTLASNLAIEVARSGKSVLLVDADYHSPRLHDIFGIDNKAGFTDMVGATSEAQAGLVSAWVTRIPNLAVLTCGQGRLAQPERFREVVDGLRAEFDAVIFDLPAVLADDFTAGGAGCLDAVAIVISSEYTTPQSAELAVRRLAVGRAQLAGAVFNKVCQSAPSRRLSSLATSPTGV